MDIALMENRLPFGPSDSKRLLLGCQASGPLTRRGSYLDIALMENNILYDSLKIESQDSEENAFLLGVMDSGETQ